MLDSEIKFIQTPINNQELLTKAKTLENFGYLHSYDNSYYYLKINDEYVIGLFELLEDNNFYKIPNYFNNEFPTGAHISFAYSNENIIINNCELNQKHYFSIKNLSHIKLYYKEYYVLMVSAPSLKLLRNKCKLPAALSYKLVLIDFHITIAVKA